MIHYDGILGTAVQVIEELWKEEKKAKAYIIQNVYGKLQIYIDTEDEDMISRLKNLLADKSGYWLGVCGSLQDNEALDANIRGFAIEGATFAWFDVLRIE